MGAAFGEQLPEDGAMASGFVGAVATERKIGLVRQGGKGVEEGALMGVGHFLPVFLHEATPVPVCLRGQGLLYELAAGCQHG